jgi:hypothetical protein
MSGLSSIIITFVPGQDIHQESTPTGKLWKSTLRYLQTCPGLKMLHWSTAGGDAVDLYTIWQNEDAYEE